MAKGTIEQLFNLKETKETPFIPLLYTYAAKLSQVPVQVMLTDPNELAKAISMAYQLLRYDAIVIPFDTTLEAEALGCQIEFPDNSSPVVISHRMNSAVPNDNEIENITRQGRFPVVIDATKRLQDQLKREVDFIAGISGPFTLAYHMGGEEFKGNPGAAIELIEAAGKVTTSLARFYGELGVDGIMLVEPYLAITNNEIISEVKSCYRSITNICDFYELPVVLYTKDLPPQDISSLLDFDINGIICQVTAKLKQSRSRAVKEGKAFGAGVDLRQEDIIKSIKKYIKDGGSKGFFITTGGDIPFETDIEILQGVVEAIK